MESTEIFRKRFKASDGQEMEVVLRDLHYTDYRGKKSFRVTEQFPDGTVTFVHGLSAYSIEDAISEVKDTINEIKS